MEKKKKKTLPKLLNHNLKMLLKMNGKVNDRRSLINYKLQWNCDWFTLIKLQFSLISSLFFKIT